MIEYAQEMKDNDEVKIGMLYIDGNGDKCEFIGENKSQCYFVGRLVGSESGDLSICDAHLCEPIVKITPKKQLINDIYNKSKSDGYRVSLMYIEYLLANYDIKHL